MLGWGFTRLACESCIYFRKSEMGIVIATVHVNDFLSIASTKDKNKCFKNQMKKVWTIVDLEIPRHIVGISVKWNRHDCTVALSQTVFINRIVQQFGQSKAHLLLLPMDPGLKLRRLNRNVQTEEEKKDIARLPYRSLVGCLLYIVCCLTVISILG